MPLSVSAILILIIIYRSGLLHEKGDEERFSESWAGVLNLSVMSILLTFLSYGIAWGVSSVIVEAYDWPVFPLLIGLFFFGLFSSTLFFRYVLNIGKVSLIEKNFKKLWEELDKFRKSRESEDEAKKKKEEAIRKLMEGINKKLKNLEDLPSKKAIGKLVKKIVRRSAEETEETPPESVVEKIFEDGTANELADIIADRVEVKIEGSGRYATGQTFQEESKQDFEGEGFEVETYKSGRRRADYILRIDDRVVACAGVRRRNVKKSTTLTKDDFKAGLSYAEKQGVPFIIWWWNPVTNRRWANVVEVEDLANFKGPVPTWLWHEELDPEEERERKKSQREAKRRIRELAGAG